MDIFLRNKMNGAYFEGVDHWTHQLEKAFDFRAPERVIRFVQAAHLDPAKLEIVLGFCDPRFNFALPIDRRFEIKCAVAGRASEEPRPSHELPEPGL